MSRQMSAVTLQRREVASLLRNTMGKYSAVRPRRIPNVCRWFLRSTNSSDRVFSQSLIGRRTARVSSDHDSRLGKRSARSEEHTSELQSQSNLVCRLLLEK